MSTKRLPDSLKEASEFILSNITNDTYIPLFTKSGNTEVMKKIKASVLNNGGGSSPSAQPDRVIIIDTTLTQDIEGKAYSTFAAAQAYADEHEDYNCWIELPAGDFDEQVTIAPNYFVHGNGTILTQPLDTHIVFQADTDNYYSTEPWISGCTITDFMSITPASDNNVKFYNVKDCRITNTITDGFILLKAIGCEINSVPKSDVNMTMTMLIAIECFILNAQAMVCVLVNSKVANIETIQSLNALNCDFGALDMPPIGVEFLENSEIALNGTIAQFLNCSITNSKISFGTQMNSNEAIFTNCAGSMKLKANGVVKNNFRLDINHSNLNIIDVINVDSGSSTGYFGYINLINSSSMTITNDITALDTTTVNCLASQLTIGSSVTLRRITVHPFSVVLLSSNCTIAEFWGCCDANYEIPQSVAINPPKPYMYSTDGGSTMTDDDTNATHVGMLKDTQRVFSSSPTVSDYIWIPIHTIK